MHIAQTRKDVQMIAAIAERAAVGKDLQAPRQTPRGL